MCVCMHVCMCFENGQVSYVIGVTLIALWHLNCGLFALLTKQYLVSIACLQERPAMIRELILHFPFLGRIETNTQVGILHSAIYSKCVLRDFRRQLCFTFLGYMTCSYSKIF